MSEQATPAAPATAEVLPTGAPTPAPAEGAPSAAQKPAESAPATQPGEKKPDTPDPAEKRGQSRFERRISRLHREAAEARAERDLLRRQLDESKPKSQVDPGAPKLEEFKDLDEWRDATAKFEREKAIKEHTAKQQTEAQKQAQARLESRWEEIAERGATKYEDFDEVVGEIKPTSAWSVAIMEAENGDDIAHHLGRNIKEAQRIAALPPLAQAREIGRLEERLLTNPPTKPKKPSAAPAPIAPLTGNSAQVSDQPSPKDDDNTWFRKRLKQGSAARP